ncbi:monovalent cation:proton antiporter-2 (CPA2) family protein [Aquincola tertiaricarbonis]|uniref:monovalent cation:proton antiporter-2 (CPA2) family protein n=1 Tax=Aquincola tertiaricarbonis TaxID=391953 RepID=UPI0006149D1C|nr:monovalent cation:proton antiporter-2 (CPA2) family protein [Aquincola tertiaricarbonis]
MAAENAGVNLLPVVLLLGVSVVAVPLFIRLGLGAVLGYLAAGILVGPFGLGWFKEAGAILHIAELGVVMFLFVVGLEMRPSHLWGLRRAIFGLGSLQVVVCSALLTLVGVAFGLPWITAFVCAMGFVLTSTAVVMQMLNDRGDVAAPRGRRMVAILLFEDLLIVPLLAWVALLAPQASGAVESSSSRLLAVATAAGSIGALVVAGVWLLNPLFQVLARAKAREAMTAAALLVVLGAALLMQMGGLSMALGAFLAGVLLAESTFRHQLEADIEPFRGLLLGLFFLGVGMSLDLALVQTNAGLIAAGVVSLMATKAACVYAVARLARSSPADALDRAVTMAQGGEFAFVLFTAALGAQVISPDVNANMTAIVVLSMALTPVLVVVHRYFAARRAPQASDAEAANGRSASVLVIGFGRIGQIASQGVLARGASLTVIDSDTNVIREAQTYGFKVFYGDGSRPGVLHAAGAQAASVVLVCINDRAATTRIAEMARDVFPRARLLVRAYDREHAVELARTGVDDVIRETFESAMHMGREAVRATGASENETQETMDLVRRRDAERLALEQVGGKFAGRALLLRTVGPSKDREPA